MPEFKHGEVSVAIADDLPIPAAAGTLSALDVARLPKAPRGLGAACVDTADAFTKAAAAFVPPLGITPDSLRKAARDAEAIDRVIDSVEFLLHKFKQANLLLDAEAWEQLRKVNDLVVAQGKTNPEILSLFAPLREYMKRDRPGRPVEPLPTED